MLKNIVKKISAIAMAFAILGTGSVVAETVEPTFKSSITASAACAHIKATYTNGWVADRYSYGLFYNTRYEKRDITVACARCNYVFEKHHDIRYRSEWTKFDDRGRIMSIHVGEWTVKREY